MRIIFAVIAVLSPGLAWASAAAATASWVEDSGVAALISRVAGAEAASLVDLGSMSLPAGAADAYTISGGGPGNRLAIVGTSPVALASGFRRYLRDAANCSVGWAGSQLHGLVRTEGSGASFVPAVPSTISGSTAMKWRQWGNVVVHSYSAAFWDFPRWERELDLMAMRGYNMALAFTGQEAVWANVFGQLGLKEEDLAPFFTGPAFLAWGGPRMGNIRGWQGPLAPAWRQGQLELGKQLVARMGSLGITAAMPMFAGHVPVALREKFPGSNISTTSSWAGFNCTYSCVGFLPPASPLFATIVGLTVEAFKAEFGASLPCLGWDCATVSSAPAGTPDHVWQFDMYNELLPPSNGSRYLRGEANATFAPLDAADPGAVWLLQGWMFSFSSAFWVPRAIKAYISGVPEGRMLILDLDAYLDPLWRATDGFYGAPFLWGMINDGGQRPGLFGNLTRVREGPAEAQAARPTNMQGVAFTPEGLFVNPVLYELLADGIWGDFPPGGHVSWLRRYATARYGLDLPPVAGGMQLAAGRGQVPPPAAGRVQPLVGRDASVAIEQAWGLLATAVYNETQERSGSLLEGFPTIGDGPSFTWCDTQALATAWRLMVSALERTVAIGGAGAVSPLLLFDAVDVARQVSVNTAEDLAGLLSAASNRSSAASAAAVGSRVARLMTLLDDTLASHPDFSLAGWLGAAQTLCSQYGGQALADHCAENALWQVTLWGVVEAGDAGSNLDSYAGKQWAGMTPLYARKWAVLVNATETAARAGVPVKSSAVVEAMVRQTIDWVASTAPAAPVAPPRPDAAAFVAAATAFSMEFGGNEAAVLSRFREVQDTDADGEIAKAQTGTRDPAQMASLCLTDPDCGGFNANGWLKAHGAKMVPFPGSTLWLLRSDGTRSA